MVEKEKTNKKKWIMFVILIIIIAFIILIIYNNFKVEGNYTGYQLILTAQYGGYGADGKNLGSGRKIIKKYNISENDVFSEPLNGGKWKLNVINKDSSSSPILTIIKLESDTVQLSTNYKEYVVNYDKELFILSNYVVFDGKSYSYTIKIIKHE